MPMMRKRRFENNTISLPHVPTWSGRGRRTDEGRDEGVERERRQRRNGLGGRFTRQRDGC
jgi:hypothetical protein